MVNQRGNPVVENRGDIQMVEIDRSACHCDRDALVASERADWKPGNPTGYYCDRCGYCFGFEGGYRP